ncbi:hypothetical protein ABPG75_006267 [Micractinium tetrahymenae]
MAHLGGLYLSDHHILPLLRRFSKSKSCLKHSTFSRSKFPLATAFSRLGWPLEDLNCAPSVIEVCQRTMPPKFWAKKGSKKEAAGPSRGQRGIQDFFPVSPSSAAAAAATGSAGSGASQPPAKRRKTGDAGGASSAGPKQAPLRTPEAGAPIASNGGAGNSAGTEAGSAATAAAAAAAGPSGAALRFQRERGPLEPPYVTDPSLPYTAADRSKLTPLEQQIVELKRAHPGVLLVVEVGYKYKFWGGDAVTASRVLGIYSYQDRSFLCAGVPQPRLHVHIRRLVEAGHKVGLVRQVETAAIKKAGDNKSGPFVRKLTALYTRSTLEAGELGGMVDDGRDDEEEGEEGGPPGSAATVDVAAAAAARPPVASRPAGRRGAPQLEPPASSYLVCIVEEPVGGSGGGGVTRAGTPGGALGSPASGDTGAGTQATQGPAQGASQASSQAVKVGLVAVEPSTGAVLYAQFRDGLLRGELESRLLFASPAELLLAQPASSETRRLCEHIGEQLGGAAPRLESAPAAKYSKGGRDALSAVLAFYGANSAGSAGDAEGASGEAAGPSHAPAGAAAAAAAAGDSGGAQPASAAALEAVQALPPLVLRALAHLLDYLRPFGLQAVLRLGASFQPWATAQEMRLSANTLRQLEIFANSCDGGRKGSLLSIMDQTQTPMGRRLLRSWVGKPLRQREAIEARLGAVQELAEQDGSHPVLSRLGACLKKLGDLERGITRAFHGTIRPSDFAALLHTFTRLHEALGIEAELAAAPVDVVVNGDDAGEAAGSAAAEGGAASLAGPPPLRLHGVRSPLLRQQLAAAADVQVAASAQRLLGAMDLQAAEANDRLRVLKDSEAFPDMLRWRAEVADTEKSLGTLLRQFRQTVQISSLEYKSLQNVGEYLLEIPTDLVKRVPKDWEKVNSVKKGVRFRPPEVKAALTKLELAKEHLQAACTAAWRQFLAAFADQYLPFRAAVQAVAALDCLASLCRVASTPGYCRPQLLDPASSVPQLHIEAGRHPVVELLLEGEGAQFVPNDTHLQVDGRRCMIITGPNMGGKSCYTRQCALIAIMAQLGSFVPAASARLTPLDGVYTRMGASENIALGRSTFAEELGETSAILSAATGSSLIILDELGRGTSTGDGAAIAEACLRHVVAGRGAHPLTLFITHYPDVCFRLQEALPREVTCHRMAHAEEEAADGAAAQQAQQQQGGQAAEGVQGDGQQGAGLVPAAAGGPSPAAQPHPLGHIVFLYKLVEGIAPASYGLNVARMAQLPAEVLHRAAAVAAQVQAGAEARRRSATEQEQPGDGAPQRQGQQAALLQLAAECRRFLCGALAGGQMDAEAGRRLQQRARELLAVPSGKT